MLSRYGNCLISLSLSNRSSPALTHSCLLPRKQILRTYLHARLHHHLNLGLQTHYCDCTLTHTLFRLNLFTHTNTSSCRQTHLIIQTNTHITQNLCAITNEHACTLVHKYGHLYKHISGFTLNTVTNGNI